MKTIGLRVLAGFGILVLLLIMSVFAYIIWVFATEGSTYISHERVNGVECVVIHNRITGAPKQVSCPPVQTRTVR